jgi:nitronate monooxygenase
VTTLCDILGIDLPIIQAPMASAQGSAMAIAVCNAGGLGSLPCATISTETMRQEIAAIRSKTAHPFNVNFFCHTAPAPDSARAIAWRHRLSPYYRELDLDLDVPAGGGVRTPFGADAADVLAEFQPPVVSFHFGLPAPHLLDRVRSWNPKILASATTVDEARWLEDKGVDIIIAQGWEAGGHRGIFLSEDLTTQVGTFALLPQIVAAVQVPVVAAGGIATAEGVAAAMGLGSAGVQIGTAYLLCPESKITTLHRAALKSEASRHTAVTNVFTGRPARGIVNRIIREVGPISPDAPPFPLAADGIAPLRTAAESQGSSDFSSLWSGQNATACREIPAADLTRELGRLVAGQGR